MANLARSFVLLLLFGVFGAAHAQQWTLLDGAARDVGVGADGSVWVVGTNTMPGGFGIWRRKPDNTGWIGIAGGAERIAVDATGNAWVVNSSGNIYRWNGTQWITVNGTATDIGVGANGTVWAIGTNTVPGGYGIWRSTDLGVNWTQIPGGARRVAVAPNGHAWVVNDTGAIFRFDGAKWLLVPGAAKDIGVGSDGAVFAIGTDSGIYRWNGTAWERRSGAARDISVGGNGLVWVVNDAGQIWRTSDPGAVVVNVNVPNISGPTVNVNVPNIPPPTSSTSGGQIVFEGTATLNTTSQASPTTTSGTSQTPVTGRLEGVLFPRGGTYEARVLNLVGYRVRPIDTVNPPSADHLTLLERGLAEIHMVAIERYLDSVRSSLEPQALTPDGALTTVRQNPYNLPKVRVIAGELLMIVLSSPRTDGQAIELRNWATSVYRVMKIQVAKGMVDEYQQWKNNPCGYEGLTGAQCSSIGDLFTTRSPPQDLIAKNAVGSVLSSHADEIAVIVGVGASALGAVGASAALASALGVTVGALQSGVTVSTSLFAAFTGNAASTAAAGSSAAAIGSAGWAGVVAAPVAAAVLAIVVGTTEGFKVVEAMRVEPMLKMKLGAAMTENVIIQNELSVDAGKDVFRLAFQNAAANGFHTPQSTVDGEIRFFCQAGYVCRFALSYVLNGQPATVRTSHLSVGKEQTVAVPARATNIVASGEYDSGAGWKSLFKRDLPGPTFMGFTAYGTIVEPKVKDEYPEISTIQQFWAPRQLTVTHGGGYVAKIKLSYVRSDGTTTTPLDSSSLKLGWRQAYVLPEDARNVRLQAWSYTGFDWKRILDRTWPLPPNECVKIYGTSLYPASNGECK